MQMDTWYNQHSCDTGESCFQQRPMFSNHGVVRVGGAVQNPQGKSKYCMDTYFLPLQNIDLAVA